MKPILKEIAIFWHIEDVQSVRPDLTDEQASSVLKNLKKNHDANEGITWEIIKVIADILFPEEMPKESNPNIPSKENLK